MAWEAESSQAHWRVLPSRKSSTTPVLATLADWRKEDCTCISPVVTYCLAVLADPGPVQTAVGTRTDGIVDLRLSHSGLTIRSRYRQYY